MLHAGSRPAIINLVIGINPMEISAYRLNGENDLEPMSPLAALFLDPNDIVFEITGHPDLEDNILLDREQLNHFIN